MQGGQLRNWIVIEAPEPVQDAQGQAKLQWTRVCGCWASWTNQAGVEVPTGQMPESKIAWRLTIRYRKGINHTMRVRMRKTGSADRFFNIGAVWNVDEQNAELGLNVSEGVGHG